jgi:hypothetical protein
VLEESLERLQETGASKLMAGLKFHITPSTIPDYQDLKEMIEASGGVTNNVYHLIFRKYYRTFL